MDVSHLLRLPEGLALTAITLDCEGVFLHAEATAESARCPLCDSSSRRVHSWYVRQVADLPCAGRRVRLRLQVRRFRCETPDCPRQIFAERLAPFLAPWARMTTRLSQAVAVVGLATCGELGARLGERLGIQTSPTTILRRIMAVPLLPPGTVSVLGIDEFALRRGQRYGTILVDLRRHLVVDLLPDRQVEIAAAWMKQHPELELVSRDRGGDYASAATAGAPQASQCADRFHLLKNLGEDLEGLLARHLAALRREQVEPATITPLAEAHAEQPRRLGTKEAELVWTKRAKRLARYQQVVALRQQGMSQAAIAEWVGINRSTVIRWLAHDTFPERCPCPRPSGLEVYLPWLRERWNAGCQNIAQLYRDLVAQGCTHSYRSVYGQLAHLLPEGRKKAAPKSHCAPPPPSARQALFLFLRRPEKLEAEEQATLLQLRNLHPDIERATDLVQQFAQMLRTRTGEQLDGWLEEVRTSGIHELQGFVTGVERDKAAVLAGLTRPESNAITEGHVCKLKMMKRLMFGRAGFPLLRQRVLHAV